MKKVVPYLVLCLLISCRKDNLGPVGEYVIYGYEVDVILRNSETLSKYELNSNTLRYCFENGDCESYFIDPSGNSKYVTSSNDTLEMLLDRSFKYSIDRNDFLVFKYIVGSLKVDGEREYFWSPDFGLIFVRSITWNGFRVLRKPEEPELLSLVTVLMNDKSLMHTEENVDIKDGVDMNIEIDEALSNTP